MRSNDLRCVTSEFITYAHINVSDIRIIIRYILTRGNGNVSYNDNIYIYISFIALSLVTISVIIASDMSTTAYALVSLIMSSEPRSNLNHSYATLIAFSYCRYFKTYL